MFTTITGVGYGILVLGILVFVHELGHFLAAKRVGVGVLKFSLGFGPVLFSRKVGETEYCISAIPFGGFVKMVGDESDEEAADLPRAALPENAFSTKSIGARALIVSAGPMVNLFFAAFLYTILFATGIPVVAAVVGGLVEGMPAKAAGLQVGDRVLTVNGEPVETFDEFSVAVRGSEGREVKLRVRRGDEEKDFAILPKATESKTIFGEPISVFVIGVEHGSEMITQRFGPLEAIARGVQTTVAASQLTVMTLVKLVQRVVPASQLGGPLMIMSVAADKARSGWADVLYFMAILSINLGVLNLLPVPILDGGHLVFLTIEKLRGGPLSMRHREIAQQIGMVLLLSLMGFAFYNDVHRMVAG